MPGMQGIFFLVQRKEEKHPNHHDSETNFDGDFFLAKISLEENRMFFCFLSRQKYFYFYFYWCLLEYYGGMRTIKVTLSGRWLLTCVEALFCMQLYRESVVTITTITSLVGSRPRLNSSSYLKEYNGFILTFSLGSDVSWQQNRDQTETAEGYEILLFNIYWRDYSILEGKVIKWIFEWDETTYKPNPNSHR